MKDITLITSIVTLLISIIAFIVSERTHRTVLRNLRRTLKNSHILSVQDAAKNARSKRVRKEAQKELERRRLINQQTYN